MNYPPPRVLVIDDDKDIRFLVNKTLAHAGYVVTEAEGGEKALEVFATAAPDVIFLDLTMPKMDGYETSQRLRALPGGAEVPIAFFTAHGTLDNYKKAMELGPNDFITKPVSRTELILRANALLKLKRMADELRRQGDADAQKNEMMHLIHDKLSVPLQDIQKNARGILAHAGADGAVLSMAAAIAKNGEILEKVVAGVLQRAAEVKK